MELRDGNESIGLLVMKTLSMSDLQVILKIKSCKLKHKEILKIAKGHGRLRPFLTIFDTAKTK